MKTVINTQWNRSKLLSRGWLNECSKNGRYVSRQNLESREAPLMDHWNIEYFLDSDVIQCEELGQLSQRSEIF
jgi:hypothetical protein